MIPSAPTAQRSRAPPVNMLYIPRRPPPPRLAACSKNFDNATPSRPGIGIMAVSRQMPRTIRVKRMRDFSSGILKQLANVLTMAANISGVFLDDYDCGRGKLCGFLTTRTSHEPPFFSMAALAEALKACALTVSFQCFCQSRHREKGRFVRSPRCKKTAELAAPAIVIIEEHSRNVRSHRQHICQLLQDSRAEVAHSFHSDCPRHLPAHGHDPDSWPGWCRVVKVFRAGRESRWRRSPRDVQHVHGRCPRALRSRSAWDHALHQRDHYYSVAHRRCPALEQVGA